MPAFNVTKLDDGTMDSTSLQGGQCRKLRLNLENLIGETGVGNTQWLKSDVGGSREELKTKCQALQKNGIRCPHQKQRGQILCGKHHKDKTEKRRVAICPPNENVQWVEVENDFKTHLLQCAEHLSYVLDAIQKVSPFDDDHFLCHMLKQQRKAERPNLQMPLSCLQTRMGAEAEWVPATRDHIQAEGVEVRTNATFAEHGHKNLQHTEVEIVCILEDAGMQMQNLEKNLRALAEEWTYCFSDESFTPYLHVVICHTLPIMRRHKRMGHFSQQVVENFHKLVRWFYARTNREGGGEEHVVESSMNIMQLFWGQKLLEMEAHEGEYNKTMVEALKAEGREPLCNCTQGEGVACGWAAHRGRSADSSGSGRKRTRHQQ